jgi:hypothetical protein
MSFQILEIALYNRRGDRRFIRFRPGTVNIVTGISKTGKSALIDIVDYCLGRSDYVVAHGVIRDTVIWYALLLKSGNSRILIARPIPPEGQKTGTEVFFTPTADDRTPDLADLRANSTVKALTQFLTEAAGITPNEHVPPDGQTRNPIRASVDHTKFYLYQQQNRVSDKSLLFSLLSRICGSDSARGAYQGCVKVRVLRLRPSESHTIFSLPISPCC